MKLSIITINYNNRDGLQKTIESVVSQSFKDFEWIVIDGGSNDGSRELIERYAESISYWVSEPDNGIYNAMNKGIRVSKGDYLLFLNSGDSLCDEYVIEDFQKLSFTEDIISGNIIVDDSIYNARFSPDESELSYRFMCESTILHPSSFIKKELFLKYGGYDESLRIVSDWKFFFVCLIQYSCSYRKWERCITSFNTYGISENPDSFSVIKAEREKVKSETLPYVYRTYQYLNSRISGLEGSLRLSFGDKIVLFFRRAIRKISSVACINYLKLKRFFSSTKNKNNNRERIVVSMTSWKKRIDNVPFVIESILHNTIKPDLIVLNLSEEEFPLKEHEIPVAIRDFVTKGILEIIWTSGNFKAFKKFIPTMKKYPTDVIIAIDDDFIYPEDLIKTFIDKHKQSPDSPLSGNHFLVNGSNAHCGCASLVKADYYGKYIDELLDERVLELRMDDIFYEFCAALNGVRYQYVGKLFYTNMRPIHAADGLSDFGRDDANEAMTQYLVQKIKKRYHIDMTKIHKPFFSL